MKESEFVKRNISLIDSALPDEVRVRTVGGEEQADPPFAVLSRELNSATEGANPRVGVVEDQNGNPTGFELHRPMRADLTWKVRSYSEAQRDELVSLIKDEYTLCEEKSSYFDTDTYLWNVGRTTTVGNAVVEPDWYESSQSASCRFVKRVVRDVDVLEAIDTSYDYY